MTAISPNLSAQLAKDIYDIVDNSIPLERTIVALQNAYPGIFDLTPNNVVSARTGGPSFIKTETSFGLMVYGGKSAKNSAFIILRGTKILGDLLTDLNAMWSSTSVKGHRIHDGFSQAFQSDRKSTRLNSSHVRISYA